MKMFSYLRERQLYHLARTSRCQKRSSKTLYLIVMWNALKSDLLDFVSTIAEDTTKTINNVIGEQIEEVDLAEQAYLPYSSCTMKIN